MKRPGVPILIISSLFCAAVVSASGFKDGVCSNVEFLKCVGATKTKCKNSYAQTEKYCMNKYPIDIDSENNERLTMARKYGECSTSGFISGLGVAKNKFEECSKHLESTFLEYRKKAEKEQKLNEERLQKLNELQ